MARILGIGNATLDIINTTDRYPREDSEQRAISQSIRRGGNTANTLVVLSQLGHQCSWAGTLADEPDAKRICSDFDQFQVDYSPAYHVSEGKVPTSYILSSQRNGSRTIVHVRDLPEYPSARFNELDLSDYDWLHFEGRNINEVRQMLDYVDAMHPDIPISLEIEKHRPGLKRLYDYPTLLIFSRAFVEHAGCREPGFFLESMRDQCEADHLVCAWGDQGAYAIDDEGISIHSPAHPVDKIAETLGAGDTFNAGLINALLSNEPLDIALYEACGLAAKKCATAGFNLDLNQDMRQVAT